MIEKFTKAIGLDVQNAVFYANHAASYWAFQRFVDGVSPLASTADIFTKTQVLAESDLAGEDKTVWRLSVITDGEYRYRRSIDSEKMQRGLLDGDKAARRNRRETQLG